MEIVWEAGVRPPSSRKRTARACVFCQRKKKKCCHVARSPSQLARTDGPWQEPAANPATFNDLNPEKPPAELSITTQESTNLVQSRLHNPSSHSGAAQPHHIPNASFTNELKEQHRATRWRYIRHRPTSKLLSDALRAYLEEEGAFLVLPKLTTDVLITTFISFLDSIIPIVDGAKVLRDYSSGQASILLIRAICLVTCKTEQAGPFLRINADGPLLEPLQFARTLYSGLDAAMRADLEPDRITKIQILSLMHLHNDGPWGVEESSAHLSQAIHEAWVTSLHFNVPENPDRYQCNLLWWTLRAFDRMNALFLGSLCTMIDDDIELPRPSLDTDYRSQIMAVSISLGDLLSDVIALHRPGHNQNFIGLEEFPSLSEVTKDFKLHELQTSHRNYLELWYHTAAILSCGSSLPGNAPYERRINSADQVQKIMSHDRYENLPPLPLIPYSISLSFTVAYRALRERQRNFHAAHQDLTIRFEILEALSRNWTTAKEMLRLAKKVMKILNKPGVGGQIDNEKFSSRPSESNALQVDSFVDIRTVTGLMSAEFTDDSDHQDEASAALISYQNGNLQHQMVNQIAQPTSDWVIDDPSFIELDDTFCGLTDFGIPGIFRDPGIWGISPNTTDGESAAEKFWPLQQAGVEQNMTFR